MKEYWKKLDSNEINRRMNFLNEGYQKYYNSLSLEDKKRISEEKRLFMKTYWNEISPDRKIEIIQKMHEGSIYWYNNLSEEEKKIHHLHIQNGNQKWWNEISDDERKKFSELRSIASKEYWSHINQDDRKIISERQSKQIKAFWDNLSPEEYREWDIKRAAGFNKYLSDLDMIPNKNELELSNIFNDYHLKYQWHYYNILEDKRFKDKFPANPITGSKFVSPYHQWDFIIFGKLEDILVDIDGSIHDSNKINHEVTYDGKKIDLSELISFNDSQRQYQTDGLDAYVIQCYDDKLNDETPVLSLSSNGIISFKELKSIFIQISIIDHMTDKEVRDILNRYSHQQS
jgi:hypothetical protein